MHELDSKLADEWRHWESSYKRLSEDKHERAEWLKSEVSFISGLVHRAAERQISALNRILQIGAGPVDVIDFFQANEKHAIDPLADRYKDMFRMLQDKSVNYITGVGEDLPYNDCYFDFVIIRNALDHVYDPERTLGEIHRVLKPDGLLYIWVYLYDVRTSITMRIINTLTKKFETEPWVFTLSRIKRVLKHNRFKIFLPYCLEELSTKPWTPSSFKGRIAKKLLHLKIPPENNRGFSCVAKPER